ncbi:MAG: hypothetical protein F2654_08855, partial [Actinobacteria bacterium]|nr:hypothetical protein [Actinomycetota bacterium]
MDRTRAKCPRTSSGVTMVVLAAMNSTGYKIVLLIHVLAVIIGFAPLWLTPVMVRLTAAGDKAAADGLEVSILR